MKELLIFGCVWLALSLAVAALLCRLFAINPRDD